MAPLSTIAPFLFAGLIIAVVGVLTASVGIRARRRDYRRILATGATASGVVTSIESRSGTGPCRVQVEYPTGDPGRRAQFTQETSVQAMQRLGLVLGSSLQVRFLRESPRAAFAPSLVVAEQQPAYRSALDEEQTLNRVYVVAFTSPAQTSATVRSFTNSFRWMGPGLVCLTEHGVRFVARRARWFRASRKDTLEVDLERIVNVESHGIAVRVEITDPGAGTRHVTFWTATASEAADLAARLPATRTASFVPLMSEASEFSERLATLMPTTFVTNLIFGVNVSAFVVSLAFGAGLLAQHPEVLIRLGSNFTPLTRSGEWWRLLTNTFLHFGILHIAFNMWALATNGPLAERLYGSTRYLLIYLSAGIAGSAASLWWHPVVNGAGASGAIFGIFGALLAFFLRRHGGVPLSVIQAHRTSIGIFIAYALFNGARVKGIDNAAHLGGLVTGLVLGLALGRPIDVVRDNVRERRVAVALFLAVSAAAFLALALAPSHPLPAEPSDPSARTTGRPAGRGDSAPAADGARERLSLLKSKFITEFAGVRLGETRVDVERHKGRPLKVEGVSWLYNSRGPGDNGLVEVVFNQAGPSPLDTVLAIFYQGDVASAPPGLTYMIGATKESLVEEFHDPVWSVRRRRDEELAMFEDGETVHFWRGRASSYGIQAYYQMPRH